MEQLQVDTLLMHGVRTAHLEKGLARRAFHHARLGLERRVHPRLDQLAQWDRALLWLLYVRANGAIDSGGVSAEASTERSLLGLDLE